MGKGKVFKAYTDGSHHDKHGGWAACICIRGKHKEIHTSFAGYSYPTTIGKMELTAVVNTLHWYNLHRKKGDYLLIFCDSKYVVDSINQDWIGNWEYLNWIKPNGLPAKNIELWQEFISIRKQLTKRGAKFKIKWIKGHAGNGLNAAADGLAVSHRKRKIKNNLYD